MQSMIFRDAHRTMYRGSQALEIVPEPKMVGYSPRNGAKSMQSMILCDVHGTIYLGS